MVEMNDFAVYEKSFLLTSLQEEEKLCCVCMNQRRTIQVLPCKHFSLCHECYDAIKQEFGTCPVCRGSIGTEKKLISLEKWAANTIDFQFVSNPYIINI